MKSYYIEDFSNLRTYELQQTYDQHIYFAFLDYMLEHSQYFSFVDVRCHENDKLKKTVKEIKNGLRRYRVFSERANKWPGTIICDGDHYIYQLMIYRADPGAAEYLRKVPRLFDWAYSWYPMDLAFYRDGYAWFALNAFGKWDRLYTDDETHVENLRKLGVRIEYDKEADDSEIFYLPEKLIK